MAKEKNIRVLNLGGLNLYVNPLLKKDGGLIRAVNVDSYPFGAKSKRPGYTTHLGTADGSAVNSLFSWTKDGSLFLYRASGSSLYYSIAGTGAWTLAGNGTITAGNHVGHAVLGDTLIIGDGAGSTRHTTNGTAFTDTTLAPVGHSFVMYQNRVYIAGTANLFYSTTNDATNWNTSGTSDSSSLVIPGEGTISSIFKASDRIIATKANGAMFKWDGYSLIDTSTDLGPSSPYSIAEKEGFYFFLNRDGHFGYGGAKPQLLSNAVQPFIYNDDGNGIAGSDFDTAPGVTHKYNYYLTMGTVTDDFTRDPINDAILKYDYQKNEYLTYSFANKPTAWVSYKDASKNEQLLFGDSSGQCYKYGGTALTDNGTAINTEMIYVIHGDMPEYDKKWIDFKGYFNPGCQAQIQIATSDYYSKENLDWKNLGQANNGVVEYDFNRESRSKFLFVRILDSSTTKRYTCYGFVARAEGIPD